MNVHIYPSPFKNESRLLKITKTLKDAKYFDIIYILATWEAGLKEIEALDDTRTVIRLKRNLGEAKSNTLWKAFKTFEWYWRIFRLLKNKHVKCLNCHSLPVLPLCVFLKYSKKAKLIYDTHELETETAGLAGVHKFFSKLVESLFIRSVDEIIVVSEQISDWYRRKYRLNKVWVVKNVPYTLSGKIENTNLLKDTFQIPPDEILFIYLGIIGYGRGIKKLLNVFSQLDSSKHVVFMGYGEYVDLVKEFESKYPNIHYHHAVKPEDVIQYAAGADIGISFFENVCLSHFFVFPNKIFEYVNCGLPVIVSCLPNLINFVDEHGCGWKVPDEEIYIKKTIDAITHDDIKDKKVKVFRTREQYGWQYEEPVLFNVYQKLGFKKE